MGARPSCRLRRSMFVGKRLPETCTCSIVLAIVQTIAGRKLGACCLYVSLFSAIALADRLHSEKSISQYQELPMTKRLVSL